MRAREYRVLEEAIERGLSIGYQRAYKHTDKPAPADIWAAQHREIMWAIDEYFTFDGEIKCGD